VTFSFSRTLLHGVSESVSQVTGRSLHIGTILVTDTNKGALVTVWRHRSRINCLCSRIAIASQLNAVYVAQAGRSIRTALLRRK